MAVSLPRHNGKPHGAIGGRRGYLLIADQANHAIRKVSAAGIMSTFAGTGGAGYTGVGGAATTGRCPARSV